MSNWGAIKRFGKFILMKQNYPFPKLVGLLFGLLASNTAFAQGQIPNGDFEAWTAPPFTGYEEPSSGWWTTLNTLNSIGGPETVEKTTDAHGGSYAAVLTTKQWGTLTIPGLLVSGEFDIQNPNFLVQGQPFTDLPNAFQGWFKYSPVSGDSAGLAALLTRWNTSLQKRDTLAQAAWVVRTAYPNWTEFDLPFTYFQTGITPDSILVALVSSGDGQNFNGQVGSTLWIDDVRLDYATANADATLAAMLAVQVLGNRLTVDLPASGAASELHLYDLQGKHLRSQKLHRGDQNIDLDHANGIYLVEIRQGTNVLLRQKIACIRP